MRDTHIIEAVVAWRDGARGPAERELVRYFTPIVERWAYTYAKRTPSYSLADFKQDGQLALWEYIASGELERFPSRAESHIRKAMQVAIERQSLDVRLPRTSARRGKTGIAVMVYNENHELAVPHASQPDDALLDKDREERIQRAVRAFGDTLTGREHELYYARLFADPQTPQAEIAARWGTSQQYVAKVEKALRERCVDEMEISQ